MTAELVVTKTTPLDRSPALPTYSDADWALDPATVERLIESIPENTRRSYKWAVHEFALWCHRTERVALPATPATLTSYVDFMIQFMDRAPATVEHAIGVIRAWHKRNGHPREPDTTDALDLLRGYRRKRAEKGVNQRQAVPFTKATLHQCVETLDLETLVGRRAQVALVFGFRMFSRRHVLSGLRFTDITETPDGLDVLVRADKTDKQSEGRVCSLPPLSHPHSDPVRVLRAWRDQLTAAGARTDGPLLCRFSKSYRPLGPLTGDGINNIVRQAAKDAELPDCERYTAHSLRAGGLVDALQRGVPPGIAARHGGWDPESPMLGRYSRVANRWRDNALQGA